MLIEFSVENFRSIRDKVTLSMIATSSKELEQNLIKVEINKGKNKKGNLNLLKEVAIYGANAAGKSNIIKAMQYVLWCIKKSQSFAPNQSFPCEQFKLDEKYLKKPSAFEFSFIHNNIVYKYGLKLLKDKVVEEYLNYIPNGRTIKVFYRDQNEINLFPTKSKLSKEQQIRLQIYQEEISNNILILSLANKIKIPALLDAYNWFSTKLRYIVNRPGIGGKTSELLGRKKIDKELFLKLLQLADPTIQNIQVISKEIDITTMPSPIINDIIKEIGKRNNIDEKDININDIQAKRVEEFTTKTGLDIKGKLKDIEFKINQESDGTQKFYGVLGELIYTLNNGGIIVIDELELRLHPNLSKAIVELFSSSLNKKKAQIIFTTHNATLLDTQKLLRRDQIYFVHKYENSSSEMYSLADFNIRNDKVIQKAYLEGLFGAVPTINLEEIISEFQTTSK